MTKEEVIKLGSYSYKEGFYLACKIIEEIGLHDISKVMKDSLSSDEEIKKVFEQYLTKNEYNLNELI